MGHEGQRIQARPGIFHKDDFLEARRAVLGAKQKLCQLFDRRVDGPDYREAAEPDLDRREDDPSKEMGGKVADQKQDDQGQEQPESRDMNGQVFSQEPIGKSEERRQEVKGHGGGKQGGQPGQEIPAQGLPDPDSELFHGDFMLP